MQMRDAVFGLAFLVASTVAPSLVVSTIGDVVPLWLFVCVSLLGPLLVLVLYPLWAARRCGVEPLLKWPGTKVFVREAAIGMGCAIVTVLTLGGIGFMVFGRIQLPDPLQQLIAIQDPFSLALTCVVGVGFVPLGEELFYRGLVYGSLRRWSVSGAIVTQAIVFVLFHRYGVIYSFFVFVAGVVFGVVYEWRRTLWAPISMHLTCNTITATMLVMAFVAYGNRPLLGIATEACDGGCRITRILPDSSAEEAGLKVGDIVIRLDDQPISRPRDVNVAMEQCELGDELMIAFERSGSQMTLKTVLKHSRH